MPYRTFPCFSYRDNQKAGRWRHPRFGPCYEDVSVWEHPEPPSWWRAGQQVSDTFCYDKLGFLLWYPINYYLKNRILLFWNDLFYPCFCRRSVIEAVYNKLNPYRSDDTVSIQFFLLSAWLWLCDQQSSKSICCMLLYLGRSTFFF